MQVSSRYLRVADEQSYSVLLKLAAILHQLEILDLEGIPNVPAAHLLYKAPTALNPHECEGRNMNEKYSSNYGKMLIPLQLATSLAPTNLQV